MSSWSVRVGDTALAAKGADALVAEANAEREGRRADRLRIRAIVRIQSALRAHRERSNVMNKISSKILEKYQSAVLDANTTVEPAALLKEVIGPLTVICTKYERRSIIQRPVPSVARKKLHAAVSVAFSLSIRSLTATSQQDSLVCHSLDDPPRAMWAWPAYAVLCAHIAVMDKDQTIFGDEAQAVAAARCMFLLLDTPLPMAARTPEVMQLRSKLVLRTAAALSKSPALFIATSSCLPPHDGAPPPRVYPQVEECASPSSGSSSARKGGSRQGSHLSRLQSNLVRAAVAVVCHQQPASPGSPCEPLPHDSLYSDDSLRSAAHHWMTQLLSTPKILANQQLIREAIRVAPERFYTPLLAMLHGKGTGDTVVNLSALCALTMLMAGPSVLVPNSNEMRMLKPCKVLKDKRMLQIYLAACTRTVGKAAAGTHASAASADAHALLRVLSWPFTQNVFLLDLLGGSDIDMSSAQVQTGRGHSRMSMPEAHHDGFGVLITLYHSWIKLMRLLARGSAQREADGANPDANVTVDAAEQGRAPSTSAAAGGAADDAVAPGKSHTEASQGAEPFINLLAYNSVWMPRLWKRASLICQLPHEVHEESTVGNDISSLQGGIADLEDFQRDALHLFCELLSHALVVVGDESFHAGNEPLPLPSLRAVTLSLNSLVFHSCMKPDQAAPGAAAPTAARLDADQQQLFTLAGRCLQQLHARHVRRPFAPDNAWLAPWNVWSESNSDVQPELKKLTGLTLCVMLARAAADAAGEGKPAEASGPASAVADLLQIAPHSVPYALRVDMFRQLLRMDKEAIAGRRGGRKVTVRRDSVLEDAYKQLAPLGASVKEPFMVVFIDEHGSQEAGIDQGGLLKELLELILEKAFDGNLGLVQFTADGKAFPSPQAQCVPDGLALLEFVGMIIGKALYEGMLLDVELAPLSVLVLQHRHPALEDVYTLDPELYQSLMQIKDYTGDASDLGLFFVVEEDILGQKLEHELVPRGKETSVTSDNKLMYVFLCSHWHISRISGSASRALSRGLSKVVPIQFLRMFTVAEVNEVLGGTAGVEGIDVGDMMRHCQYKGGYSRSSPAVKMFWKAVMSFDVESRRLLLKFITGTRRAPLGGFANLAPPLVIYKVDCQAPVMACFAGPDVDRLPSASTCFSTLKLPNYRRFSTLRSKLLYAITSKAGFDLS